MAKVLISIPDDLLERLDLEAKRRGGSRSSLLRSAVRRELGWAPPAVIDTALNRGRAALHGIGGFDSSELVRRQRDAQDARDRSRQ
ncbi:MAG: CopG family ribbon-helix-helix protein [Candidatus Dormibacteria bacterium]